MVLSFHFCLICSSIKWGQSTFDPAIGEYRYLLPLIHQIHPSAENEKNPMEKRLIEHGAICYQKYAREFMECLISVLPQSSTTQEGVRK